MLRQPEDELEIVLKPEEEPSSTPTNEAENEAFANEGFKTPVQSDHED